MKRMRELRKKNNNVTKQLLYQYQTNYYSKDKSPIPSHKKSTDFDVVTVPEEEDFIHIDSSYKQMMQVPVFKPTESLLKTVPEGVSMQEWTQFKFGGLQHTHDFNKLAIVDCLNDIHLISFDIATMQLKKEFNFTKKDFKTPWNITCLDFFEQGNLLIGFDSIENDFCAFNLKKKKRSTIKSKLPFLRLNPKLKKMRRSTT
jgi:hypothetical protein